MCVCVCGCHRCAASKCIAFAGSIFGDDGVGLARRLLIYNATRHGHGHGVHITGSQRPGWGEVGTAVGGKGGLRECMRVISNDGCAKGVHRTNRRPPAAHTFHGAFGRMHFRARCVRMCVRVCLYVCMCASARVGCSIFTLFVFRRAVDAQRRQTAKAAIAAVVLLWSRELFGVHIHTHTNAGTQAHGPIISSACTASGDLVCAKCVAGDAHVAPRVRPCPNSDPLIGWPMLNGGRQRQLLAAPFAVTHD